MTTEVLTAARVAEVLGTEVSLKGRPDRPVGRPMAASACTPNALTFLKPDGRDLEKLMSGLDGATVICPQQYVPFLEKRDVTLIISGNPRLSFIRALGRCFAPPLPPTGVHPRAEVSPAANVHATASIAAGCFVGAGCAVGAGSVLHPNVVLYENVRLGKGVIIHAGTVIGADGFGYERDETGAFQKFPHVGGVVIEDDVEIGSNTSIDRGTLEDTIIRTGARIDNQCHISHNVQVGRHAAVIAQSMIGGSAKIGDFAWLAPGALIMNQIRVGERATVGLGAVITKDVPDNETFMGSPATSAPEFRRIRQLLRTLAAEGLPDSGPLRR